LLYLNGKHLKILGIDWCDVIDTIYSCVSAMRLSDYAQPIKPYLRYRDLKNRIIAMPAFVGGQVSISGIKWIASFPDNLKASIPRAHSITVLNNADTGIPVCMVNSPVISGIRTAAVSGYVIRKFFNDNYTPEKGIVVGIVGFGPIGRLHLEMVCSLLGDQITTVRIFDIAKIEQQSIPDFPVKIELVNSWEEAFADATLFMTCTVSKQPYIDKKPAAGSLHLNVSLRDYRDSFLDFVDHVIVDDWEEVCRELTDIERMSKNKGLKKEDTYSIVTLNNDLQHELRNGKVVMFNPMGMAAFDIAIGNYYMKLAQSRQVGVNLE
jgi:2,3-diaminopropionate biosynthesis protein SbnB